MAEKASRELVRGKNGQFVAGTSGNPSGRPKGSKNIVTIQKLMVEEAFRASTSDDMAKVLTLIVMQALEGDKASQKLIWDANMSKQTVTDDKSVGNKQAINVRVMGIREADTIEGEVTDLTEEGS